VLDADISRELEIADWRRRVAALHLTMGGGGEHAVSGFRAARDALFRDHPASPLTAEQRQRFAGVDYYEFDPGSRVEVELRPDPRRDELAIDSGGEDGVIRYSRAGRVETPWGELTVFWMRGYGGNLFLPFRDATAPEETYGAGRYLTDAVKGTHAGGLTFELPAGDPPRLTLDFNYAYNPSCAYNSRWACPLAPPENRVELPIRAGERKFSDPA
jgi:uncharacterized protein (DUF1684 family)